MLQNFRLRDQRLPFITPNFRYKLYPSIRACWRVKLLLLATEVYSEFMRYVKPKYEKQLADLAELLIKPERFGAPALQDTVEFEPLTPPTLRLCDPPELGWDYTPPTEAA